MLNFNLKGGLITMKKAIISFFAVLSIAATAAAPIQKDSAEVVSVPGKVNADKLNLRLGPGVKNPVVGSVPVNTELKIMRVTGSWVEVAAPDTLKIYVSEARINQDGTLAGELNMRCAMDVKSPSLGILPKGTKVERMDERRNGWVRIKVPAGVKVYAAAFFVNFDTSKFDEKGMIIGVPAAAVPEKSVPELTPPATPAAAPAEKAVLQEAANPAKAEPEKVVPAAETVEVSGVLTKWEHSSAKETAYALLDAPDGLNLAFVTADDTSVLNNALNKKVRIVGKSAGKFGNSGVTVVKTETITIL